MAVAVVSGPWREHGEPDDRYVPLRLVPVTLAEARAFVARVHRHNEPPLSHRVSVGVADQDGVMRGVAILGRPVARGADDGRTAEVYRVATDGVRNGCSMLYGACARAAFALGYDRVITYTLESEPGTSLRAAGWSCEGVTDSRPKRQWESTTDVLRRTDRPTLFWDEKHPTERKVRWSRAR